jgi:sulfide:quinone oxidoreductase
VPHEPTIAERVVIAGGGVAALETLLALRYATDGAAREVTVVAPGGMLVYRPLAVTEPFGPPEPRRYRLDEICEDLGARLVPDTVAAVEGGRRRVRTGSGLELAYDALVVATGARAVPALGGAFTFSGDEEPGGLRWIVGELASGEARSVAFVVPAGTGWSLPIYELALMTARRAADAGAGDVALTLVTPEDRPLAIFQGAGSDAVARLLAEVGIAIETDAYAHAYDGRTLLLEPGRRRLAADRVVALPRLTGPAIDGLPSDPVGFVRVDERNRVPHMDRVWAIGDATTFPVKHGGIATQQADVVAAAISGSGDGLPPLRPQVRAILYTGEQPLFLTATITAGESVVSSVSERCPWWPPHKIAARHLAPYLADRVPLDAVGAHPSGRREAT